MQVLFMVNGIFDIDLRFILHIENSMNISVFRTVLIWVVRTILVQIIHQLNLVLKIHHRAFSNKNTNNLIIDIPNYLTHLYLGYIWPQIPVMKCILLHYIPLTAVTLYPCIFYMVLVFFNTLRSYIRLYPTITSSSTNAMAKPSSNDH